jgi:predicted O-methyltransferase YrrM
LDHYHHLYPRWRYEIEGRDSAPESRIDGLRSLDPESWCIRDDSTDHGAIGKRDKIVQEPPTASNLTTSTVKASAHTDPLKPYHQACELAEQKNYGRVRILISEFASHTSMILDAGDCTNPQADKSMKDSEGTAASQRSSDAWDLADSSSLWQAGNLSIAHMPGTSMISVNGVRGFLTRGDVSFLCDLAGELPDGGRYLEVGSWLGLSSILIATQLIANRNFDAKVFCVDTWEGSPEHQGEEEITERTLYDEFRRNVLSAGVGRVISPVRMPSVQAEKHWNQGPLDVVFIDGDHSAKSCLSDIEAWLPRLKSGGRMLGHDAVPGGSVEEALKTFRNRNGVDYKIHEAPDTHFIWELVLGDSHATGTSEVGVGLHGP